jgi:hypothetical protein
MKPKCELCGIKYEEYIIEKFIPELNGNTYCKTCRDFLKFKLKKGGKRK